MLSSQNLPKPSKTTKTCFTLLSRIDCNALSSITVQNVINLARPNAVILPSGCDLDLGIAQFTLSEYFLLSQVKFPALCLYHYSL